MPDWAFAEHPSPRTLLTPRTPGHTMTVTKEENKAPLFGTEKTARWNSAEIKLPQPPSRASEVSRAPKGLICSHLPPGGRCRMLASHFTTDSLPAFPRVYYPTAHSHRAVLEPSPHCYWDVRVINSHAPRSRERGVSISGYTGEKEDPWLPNDSF